MTPRTWPSTAAALEAEQARLAALTPPEWVPPAGPVLVGGCFLAVGHGPPGPGRAGAPAWAGAAVLECPSHRLVERLAVACTAGAPYEPGLLALRDGPGLAAALDALSIRPQVLMVDATGRDHPRRAGLALHLGALLDLPTVGVTHRPLCARGPEPGPKRGDVAPLRLPGADGEVVGFWVRTRPGARPVAVHAGWRVDPRTTVALVLQCTGRARTPEPLRQARHAARLARARAEGRLPT